MSTMGLHKSISINHLYRLLPEGMVVSTAWLGAQGYSRQLLQKYKQSGWLVSVARGAFRRPGQEPGWEAITASLEKYWNIPCHAGGRTALKLHGYSHYLALGKEPAAQLYAETKYPAWISSLRKPCLVLHASSQFDPDSADAGMERMQMDGGRFSVRVSRPERAILEFLADVPQRETFEDADKLMEGLVNLSPSRVMALLPACKSVKVRRLFMWLAERHGHAWLRKLELEKIDLGSGKRMLVKGGRLVSKYQITVPKEMINGFE